jgi:hypothetical protein
MSLSRTVLFTVLLLSAGCDDPSTMILQLANQSFPANNEILVEVSQSGRVRRFMRADFQPTADMPSFHTKPFELDRDMFTVRTTLLQGTDTAASGSIQLNTDDDEDWLLTIHRGVDDPRLLCSGCRGSVRFDISPHLQRAPGEALWMSW